jgi:hypothetical protein
VPGAEVDIEGTYGLVDRRIDLHGELRLDAKLSETTSGIKSFFLKLVDPLFKKKDAGAVIPIRVGGTPDDPSFGLEVGRLLNREPIGAARPGTIRTCASILETEGTAEGLPSGESPPPLARDTESSREKPSSR